MQLADHQITTQQDISHIADLITQQIKKNHDCPVESIDIVSEDSNVSQLLQTGDQLFNQSPEDCEFQASYEQINSSQNDRSCQSKPEGSQPRKKKKFLSKKEIAQLRDIFEQHPDPPVHSQYSSQNLAKNYKVCRETISRLRSAFFKDPTLRYFLQKKAKTSVTGRVKGSINQSTKVVRNLICKQLANNRYITRKELQQAIMLDLSTMRVQVKVPTLKTISKILKSLNIVRKRIRQVPKTRNEPDIIEKRYAFCKQYSLIYKSNSDIIFFDSRAFDLAQPSSFAWIQKGTDPQYEKPSSSKAIKVSLLAAVSRAGTIAWETRVGNYSTTQFTRVSMKILTTVQSISKTQGRHLVLNSAKTHFEMALKQILSAEYKLVYLPAYCPQLNAIQYWFNEVRDSVNKRKFHTVYQLQNVINQECNKLRAQPRKNYFQKINTWVQLGLKKEKF